MKNLKFLFAPLMVAAAMLLTFASCSDDDDDDPGHQFTNEFTIATDTYEIVKATYSHEDGIHNFYVSSTPSMSDEGYTSIELFIPDSFFGKTINLKNEVISAEDSETKPYWSLTYCYDLCYMMSGVEGMENVFKSGTVTTKSGGQSGHFELIVDVVVEDDGVERKIKGDYKGAFTAKASK